MNRRQFLAGLAAAPVVAQVGAVERFLVGKYGAPSEVEWYPIDVSYAFGAMALMTSMFMKNVDAQRAANRVAMKMLTPAVAEMGEKFCGTR